VQVLGSASARFQSLKKNQKRLKTLKKLEAVLKRRHWTLLLMPQTQSHLKESLSLMLDLSLSPFLSSRSQRLRGKQGVVL